MARFLGCAREGHAGKRGLLTRHHTKLKAAFTQQTKVGVCELKTQQQLANMLKVGNSRLPIVHTSNTSLPARKGWLKSWQE